VLRDAESSPLPEKEKALFRFVAKVNHASPSMEPPDIKALHDEGWSDEAIYDAITVCALFNFLNRWVDAAGVHAMSEAAHRMGGKRMARDGYVRSAPEKE
jgi:alkylhydroperoxidase family enzyme